MPVAPLGNQREIVMGRRSRDDGRLIENLFQFLSDVPFWVGPILAGVLYVGLAWLTPWWLTDPGNEQPAMRPALTLYRGLASGAAPYVSIFVLVVWVAAEIRKWITRVQFDGMNGPEDLRKLSWGEFEHLLGEYYRRQQFDVEHSGSNRADGGVDLRLRKDGRRQLLQCKHWQVEKVGVKVVRELLGVVTAEKAESGIVVTSGTFTKEAQAFARGTSIQLIDGAELLKMVASVRKHRRSELALLQEPITPSAPACPRCGAEMEQKVAKKGSNAGGRFWGCTNYPGCKGTAAIQA